MLNAVNTQFFVLTSKSRKEQRTCDNLTTQSHEDFYPKIAQVIKRDLK
jgi:hypothetical protein